MIARDGHHASRDRGAPPDAPDATGGDAATHQAPLAPSAPPVHPGSTSSSPMPGGLTTSRLEALVDGVFAVVMTLLILDIHVPQVTASLSAAETSRQLGLDLIRLLPNVLAYAISFVLAGIYWVGHHNQYPFIRRSDRILLWINLLFLLFVVFIPFSAALLGAYPHQELAVIVYGCNLIVIGLVLYLQWWYATTNHRLVHHDLDPALVRMATRRILIGPACYSLAIGLSFVSTTISIAIYALVPLLHILPGRVDRHHSFRGVHPPAGPPAA